MQEQTHYLNQLVADMDRRGWIVERHPGWLNVVYLENTGPDFVPRTGAAFPDLRVVFTFDYDGRVVLCHASQVLAHESRVVHGQYEAWSLYFHQSARYFRLHPALLQKKVIELQDGRVIQHSANQIGAGGVGRLYPGCTRTETWPQHLDWIAALERDPRRVADKYHLYLLTFMPCPWAGHEDK